MLNEFRRHSCFSLTLEQCLYRQNYSLKFRKIKLNMIFFVMEMLMSSTIIVLLKFLLLETSFHNYIVSEIFPFFRRYNLIVMIYSFIIDSIFCIALFFYFHFIFMLALKI